jgi:hypothetical protein
MKTNSQKTDRVREQLKKALSGVKGYIDNWAEDPKDFTTLDELRQFDATLCEMLASLDKNEAIPVLGLWRIMETWPFKNDLRQQIVEAELAYERMK